MKQKLIRLFSLLLVLSMLLSVTVYATEEEIPEEPEEEVTETVPEESEEPAEPEIEYEYPDDWSRDALVFAVENGILNGDNHHNLNPHNNITRAEMAAILVRMLGATATGNLAAYQDVSTGDWFYTELSVAVAAGIFNGVTGNTMQPNAPLTREQAVVVMTRAFGIADTDRTSYASFSDGDSISVYARDAVSAMVKQELISGYADGTIRPKTAITRAEVAQLIYNMFTCIADTAEEIPEKGRVLYRGSAALPDTLILDGTLILGQAAPVDIAPAAWQISDSLVIRTGKNTTVDASGITAGALVIAPLSGTAKADHSRVFLGGELTFTGKTVYLTALNGKISVEGDCEELSVREGANLTVNGAVNGDVTVEDSASLDLTGSCRNVTMGKYSSVHVRGDANVVRMGHKSTLTVDGKLVGMYFETGCTVTLEQDVAYLDVNKDNVTLTLNGKVKNLDVSGNFLKVSGKGSIGTVTVTGAGAEIGVPSDLYNDYSEIKTCKIPCYAEFDCSLYQYNGGGGYICTIPAGAKVYNEYWPKGNWMLVTTEDGVRGWVSRYNFYIDVDNADFDGQFDYSDGAKEHFVNSHGYESKTEYLLWINRYTQKVMFFQGSAGNWKLYKTAPCASGSNYTPTPEGVYEVYAKQDLWDFGGYGVWNVTLFSGEMAFHSILLGYGGYVVDGTISEPASHGCVRMLPEDAKYIHDNIPVKTTVIVY